MGVMVYCDFFFFKQKTAYEMRISDWSSDVCSSDLRPGTAFTTGHDRASNRRSVFVRGTLKFEPSSAFDARLKLSYNSQTQDNPSDIKQKIVCPYGQSQVASTVAALGGNPALKPLLAIDDCRPNKHFTHGTLPQNVAALANGGLSTSNDLGTTSIFLGSL